MRVRSTIKKRCTKCKTVRRRAHLYIICEKGRHKQKQA